MAEGVKKEWLAGLKFTGAKEKEVDDDGQKRKKSIPFERALQPGDVLDFKETPTRVTLVSADGRKHVVDLTGKK